MLVKLFSIIIAQWSPSYKKIPYIQTYLRVVGNISTAYALIGPIVRPITGIDERSIANNIVCFTTLISMINVPMAVNINTSSTFFPINFTVLLRVKAITAQEMLAIELIVKIIGSRVSMHPSSVSDCEQNNIDYLIEL